MISNIIHGDGTCVMAIEYAGHVIADHGKTNSGPRNAQFTPGPPARSQAVSLGRPLDARRPK